MPTFSQTLKSYIAEKLRVTFVDNFKKPLPPQIIESNSSSLYEIEITPQNGNAINHLTDIPYTAAPRCTGTFYKVVIREKSSLHIVGKFYIAFEAKAVTADNFTILKHPTIETLENGMMAQLLVFPRNYNTQNLRIRDDFANDVRALDALEYKCDIDYWLVLTSGTPTDRYEFFLDEIIGKRTEYYRRKKSA